MTDQERNLRILKYLGLTAAVGAVVVLLLLYYGNEPPFYEMEYQHTDPTGYAPPPTMAAVTAAGVPRRIDLQPVDPSFSPDLPDAPAGVIPPEAAALTNPLAGRPRRGGRGKVVYEANCAQCHGKAGRGDGPVGDSYVPAPPDLTSARVQALPDGALFYTITNGILSTPVDTAARYLPREWHAYRRISRVEERWAAVTYIKSWETTNATPR